MREVEDQIDLVRAVQHQHVAAVVLAEWIPLLRERRERAHELRQLGGDPIELRRIDGEVPVREWRRAAAEPRPDEANAPDGGAPRERRLDPCRDVHTRISSLAAMSTQAAQQPVAVVGAGLDLGAGRRGVDMGPSAIRYAGLDARLTGIGRPSVDWGNVEVAVPEATAVGSERVRFLEEIKASCERVADLVVQALGQRFFPLVLGGDHSVALGTLGGLARARGPGGVLWIDAHGDLNRPETSPSGNVHGMPLAAALGLAGTAFESPHWRLPAVEPRRVALLGVRALDPAERELLGRIDARVHTMSDIDRVGVERAVEDALAHVAGDGFVHVSLDMDALDPEFAPGVGTPVRGGLSYREAHLALELVAESGLAGSLEVVEVNPILDRANATAELAVELIASALGAKIL